MKSNRFVDTLRSGWLTTGYKVKQFRGEFRRDMLALNMPWRSNSGTAALHLALDAVGIKEGDEVILPTMTFAATAEVVLYFKAKPVLVDCQRRYSQYRSDRIEARDHLPNQGNHSGSFWRAAVRYDTDSGTLPVSMACALSKMRHTRYRPTIRVKG